MIERFDYRDVVSFRPECGANSLQERDCVLDASTLSRERGRRPFCTAVVPCATHDLKKDLQPAHHHVMGGRKGHHIVKFLTADLCNDRIQFGRGGEVLRLVQAATAAAKERSEACSSRREKAS